MPDLYVSGGYYLIRRTQIVSASGCLCEFFPDSWAIAWASATPEESFSKASAFGISPASLTPVIEWATDSISKEFGWPRAFYRLQFAQAACAQYLPANADNIVLFGLGLHESNVGAFLEAAKPPAPTPGYSPMGETGVFECVKTMTPIDATGEALGFELLSTYLGMLGCSWRCNALPEDCSTKLGVGTNKHGLVETYDDAIRCAEFISREETGAEPGLWLPWLITVYQVSE